MFSELYSTLSFTFFSSFLVEKHFIVYFRNIKLNLNAEILPLPGLQNYLFIFLFLAPPFYFAGIKIHAGNAADQENNYFTEYRYFNYKIKKSVHSFSTRPP